MARTLSPRRKIVRSGYSYSLRFLDSVTMSIQAVGAANYTTSIISNYTILVYCNLDAIPNSSATTHSLISNNAATLSTNMLLTVDKFTRTVSNRITDGVTSQTLTSTTRVPYGWGWVGESYQAGTQLRTIVGTTIESTAPTITAVANSSRTLWVGSTNSSTFIRGNIARVWIFGGQITQAELNDVVYSGKTPASLTPALIWNITDGGGSGTNVPDTSGNGNNGTIAAAGPAWTTTVPDSLRTLAASRTLAHARTLA